MALKLGPQSQSGNKLKTLVTELVKQLTNSTPKDQEATLSTLKTIFDNIMQHPNDDKYRKIKLSDKSFSNTVWCYPAAVNVMKMAGWEDDGNYVRLTDGSDFKAMSELLERELQKLRMPTPKRPWLHESVSAGASISSQCCEKCCALTKDIGWKIIAAVETGSGQCLN